MAAVADSKPAESTGMPVQVESATTPLKPLACPSIQIPRSGGISMPQIGLGTWCAKGDDCYHAVLLALRAGVRHVDTASVYKNEEAIGKAIKDSGIKRADIFITSKLHPADAGSPEKVLAACKESLGRLQISELDLYLVHWPGIAGKDPKWKGHGEARAKTWSGMEQVLEAGLSRCIGVSNWLPAHLDDLASGKHSEDGKGPKVFPQVNQFELHPLLQQRDMQASCEKHGVLVQPYCPLARADARLFKSTTVLAMAKKYSRTPAQVAIRWAMQKGWPCIPKSVTPSRILENFSPDVLAFELSDEEVAALDGLEVAAATRGKGTGACDSEAEKTTDSGRLCWDPTVVA